jgi:hypothetical protein
MGRFFAAQRDLGPRFAPIGKMLAAIAADLRSKNARRAASNLKLSPSQVTTAPVVVLPTSCAIAGSAIRARPPRNRRLVPLGGEMKLPTEAATTYRSSCCSVRIGEDRD